MEHNEYKELMDKLSQRRENLPQDASKAKIAVLMGIDKASEEKSRQKKHQIISLRICFTCLAVMCFAIIGLNSNFGWYETLAKVPVIGAVADVFTFNRYQNVQGDMDMDVAVARVNEYERSVGVNEQIDEYANELVNQYNQEVEESNGQGRYSLQSDYAVKYEDEAYLCIEVYTSEIMASSNQYVKTFTIDKESGQAITLGQYLHNDTVLMSKVGDNIIQQMKQQMIADENITYWIDETPLGDYSFSSINGSEDFYLIDQHTIVVIFDEYEVAPGSMGVVEFVVDLDSL